MVINLKAIKFNISKIQNKNIWLEWMENKYGLVIF